MKKIMLIVSIIGFLLSTKTVSAQENLPPSDTSSVVTSIKTNEKSAETKSEKTSIASFSTSTSSSTSSADEVSTQNSSTPVPSKSEVKTSDINTTTKKASDTDLKLDGMTWQKITGTGSEVNFGVAFQSSSSVTFAWQYYDISTSTWVTINKNTTSNWISFKAPHIGQYLIHVSGTTVDGVTKDYTIGWQVEAESIQLTGMTWQNVSKDGAKASIGIAYQSNSPVTFTWQYYDVSKKEWHVIASDTTSNWVSVQLPRSGDYLLYVEAKTSGGQTSHYTIGWQVQAEYVDLNGMTWHTLKGDGSKFDLGIAYQSNSPVTFTWQYYDVSKKE